MNNCGAYQIIVGTSQRHYCRYVPHDVGAHKCACGHTWKDESGDDHSLDHG